MSLRLRAGTYHTEFVVNGQRIRQTLETTDWREATQRERELMSRAKEGKIATGPTHARPGKARSPSRFARSFRRSA